MMMTLRTAYYHAGPVSRPRLNDCQTLDNRADNQLGLGRYVFWCFSLHRLDFCASGGAPEVMQERGFTNLFTSWAVLQNNLQAATAST